MSEQRSFSIGYSIPNSEDFALTRLGPALDEAAEIGVDVVELPLYAMDLIANGRIIRDRLARVKTITQGRPIGYTIHGPLGLNLLENDANIAIHRDVLKAMLEAAAELGGKHFVAHAGIVAAGEVNNAEARFARQREILAGAGDFAAQHGLHIAVENLFGGRELGTLPSQLAKEIEAIAHPAVCACLDFSHAYLLSTQRGVDFVDEAVALAQHAKHLHVHDSFGKLSLNAHFGYRSERLAYGIGDLHLPIGLGSIPWDTLAERCRFPADPVFIHELAPPYWSELGNAVANTRALAEKAAIAAPS